MKHLLLPVIIFLTLAGSCALDAQARGPKTPKEAKEQRDADAPSPEREQWLTELRQYKRNYFTKELDLSREQQQKFFPLYEEMGQKIADIQDEARTMERRIAEADDATDTEYRKATEVLYDADLQEAQLRKDYSAQFADILTPDQLFRLKGTERDFARELVKQHQRIRASRKK